jgi:DNA-binding CsgD family transcriptional regulator
VNEPLRGAELRAALAAICDPLRGIPPVTEYRLEARQTPAMASRRNGKRMVAKFIRRNERKGPRAATVATEARMLAMWNAGHTLDQIGQHFGKASRTVQYALRARGIRFSVGQGKAALSREEFAARFHAVGAAGIAAEYGMRLDCVRKRASRMGLLP